MKALVTGGAGFIGSHLVGALLGRGDQVRVLDNLSTGHRENLDGLEVDLRVVDLSEAAQVRATVSGIDTVFHLAAMISVPASMQEPAAAYQANVLGSLNVLEAARREGVRRVVLSSSCAVYGDSAETVSETSPTRPLSPYAASKLAMEDLARLYCNAFALETVCLRYFNVYGPRQDPRSPYAAVIPLFIRSMLAGEPVTVFGDGQQSRDFVYVGDVVQANLLASEASGAAGEILNIGTGTSVSVKDLVAALRGLIRQAPEPMFGPERPGDIRFSSGEIRKAAETLGYRPARDLQQGLRETVEWGRAHAGPVKS
ncbi:MAG TPA: SDR family oxidoreductase [Anaerolineales bacterium]|nr:SDR family oxidoreductase [Anaerolineales bacterium]